MKFFQQIPLLALAATLSACQMESNEAAQSADFLASQDYELKQTVIAPIQEGGCTRYSGDVTDDGVLNDFDTHVLVKMIEGFFASPLTVNADANSDGEITILDPVYILTHQKDITKMVFNYQYAEQPLWLMVRNGEVRQGARLCGEIDGVPGIDVRDLYALVQLMR